MPIYRDTRDGSLWAQLDLPLEDEHKVLRTVFLPLSGEGTPRTVPLTALVDPERIPYRVVLDEELQWRRVPCVLRMMGDQMRVLERSGLLQEFLDKSGLRYAIVSLWATVQALGRAVRAQDASKF